nr:hypothetical protein [Tanacetum cinerariifolium]
MEEWRRNSSTLKEKRWFFQEYIFQIIRKGFKFKIRREFFERCFDFIIGADGDFLEWQFSLIEWRILLPSSRRESKSSSKISSITSILKHVSSFDVKKRSSQDERNFVIFFHFENNEIDKKGLRVSRDSFAYKEYGIRLMLAPRSTKTLQEKVLLKLHGIRKLSGSSSFGGTLFWIIAELSLL